MSEHLSRRRFLKKSISLSAGITAGLSLEEKDLLTSAERKPIVTLPEGPVEGIQKGIIGKFEISRIICGGNLISAQAHSGDLLYVSSLLKHYFTDDKVIEILKICEENGINTTILRCDTNIIRILKRYWNEFGGKIQWLAQTYPKVDDLTSNIQMAIDAGAIGAFMDGGSGMTFVKEGRIKEIEKVFAFIKGKGLIAGIGSHTINVPITVEREGLNPDFYFKTINTGEYVCDDTEETIKFMRTVKKPWIGYKVLGAGRIDPRRGFNFAFANGTDFINVGMFDYQIKEDVVLAKNEITNNSKRERPWCA